MRVAQLFQKGGVCKLALVNYFAVYATFQALSLSVTKYSFVSVDIAVVLAVLT